MKTAKELYPDLGEAPFYGPGNYQPILDSFGTIIIQIDDDDYQGDSRVLYSDGSRYGYLQFGWGSCSGCDALQACTSMQDIQDLIEALNSQIRWFDAKDECLAFFIDHDWEGDYAWHTKEQAPFIARVKEFLGGIGKRCTIAC